MFIRTKIIKERPYAYLVENVWRHGRSVQRVRKYLGPVRSVPVAPLPVIPEDIEPSRLLRHVIDAELLHAPEEIVVHIAKKSVFFRDKPVVLALNGGYLCNYTLATLVRARHAKNEERPGTALATAFSDAGLRIPQDAFITFYRHYQ